MNNITEINTNMSEKELNEAFNKSFMDMFLFGTSIIKIKDE